MKLNKTHNNNTWKAELGHISEFFRDLIDIRGDIVDNSGALKLVSGFLSSWFHKKEGLKQFGVLHSKTTQRAVLLGVDFYKTISF